MAVDRRAVVTTRPIAGGHFVVTAPGHAEGQWRFQPASSGDIAWLDEPPAGSLALVEAVFAEVEVLPEEPVAIDIDTRGFADAGTGLKLGIGSSAAVAVALTAALRHALPARDVFRYAGAAHRRIQHGAGSGVDVATCCHGGVISFRRDGDYPPEKIGWPAGLHYRFFFGRRAARTTDAIQRALRADDRQWAVLVAAAGEAAQVLKAGNADAVPAAIAEWTLALRRFDAAADIGIFAGGHAKMAELAARCGVTFKPCGAGGGDVGIALAADIADIEFFCRRAPDAGFLPLDILRDERGVTAQAGESG